MPKKCPCPAKISVAYLYRDQEIMRMKRADHQADKRISTQSWICSWDYNLSVVGRPESNFGTIDFFWRTILMLKNKKGISQTKCPQVVTRSCSWNYCKKIFSWDYNLLLGSRISINIARPSYKEYSACARKDEYFYQRTQEIFFWICSWDYM